MARRDAPIAPYAVRAALASSPPSARASAPRTASGASPGIKPASPTTTVSTASAPAERARHAAGAAAAIARPHVDRDRAPPLEDPRGGPDRGDVQRADRGAGNARGIDGAAGAGFCAGDGAVGSHPCRLSGISHPWLSHAPHPNRRPEDARPCTQGEGLVTSRGVDSCDGAEAWRRGRAGSSPGPACSVRPAVSRSCDAGGRRQRAEPSTRGRDAARD